jgi:tetratricopeptide (TPR) repeat protein
MVQPMNRKQRRAAARTQPAAAIATLAERANASAQSGNLVEAERLYRQARAQSPRNAALVSNHGNILLHLGHADRAIDCYRQAIDLNPNEAAFYSNLGNALVRTGKIDDGIAALRQGLAINPLSVETNFNLGNALMQIGQLDEAIPYLKRTLELKPAYAEAWSDLGNILFRKNLLAEAEEAYRQALALKPDMAEIYSNLSNVLMNTDRTEEAMGALMQSIRLKPHFAQAHSNLGNLLTQLDRLEEAIGPYREAIRLDSHYPEPWSNMGNVLVRLGRHDEALAAYDRAVAIRPDYAEAQVHRAFLLLQAGRTDEGWPAYEWRWKARAQSDQDRPKTALPEWHGESLNGKRIMIYHEQGYGDTLQFCRYAADVAALGAEVIFLAPRQLDRVLQDVPGIARVITSAGVDFMADYQVPLMSVPGLLGKAMGESIATVPYIRADPALAEGWKLKLAGLKRFRVGLVWAGDPRPHDRAAYLTDRRRSLSFAQIAPLFDVQGVDFVSLQKGAGARQIDLALPLFDPTVELKDFADTAALIANLDLVIAADTSVAHVAGALGKPVWILSRFDGCWRWLLGRDDTPWYPAARIFRQAMPGAWEPVIDRVAEALGTLSGARTLP